MLRKYLCVVLRFSAAWSSLLVRLGVEQAPEDGGARLRLWHLPLAAGSRCTGTRALGPNSGSTRAWYERGGQATRPHLKSPHPATHTHPQSPHRARGTSKTIHTHTAHQYTWETAARPRTRSAGVHAEELDALGVPVEAHGRVEHQRPHVGHKEVLRLILLHVLELQFWKFLKEEQRESEIVFQSIYIWHCHKFC